MAQFASLVVPMAALPQPDHSWLGTLGSSLSQGMDNIAAQRNIMDDLSRVGVGSSASQPQGSFISRLMGGTAQQPVAAPAPSMGASAVPNQPPIPGIQMQASSLYGNNGIDVAATENYIRQAAQARGIDPDVAVRVARSEGLAPNTWQSNYVKNGKRETSYGPFQLLVGGGLGDKFQKIYGKSPADPSTLQQQIDFALDEAAQGGWSPWYGAAKVGVGPRTGLDQARALGYQAGPATAAEAVTAMGEGGNLTGYVDPMVSAPNSRQPMPANQVADASGGVPMQSQQPVPVDANLIKRMVMNPITRERGLEMWRTAVEGRQKGYDFMMAPNGELIRTSKDGTVERVGNFGKPEGIQSVSKGAALYNPNTGEWITPPQGAVQADATEYGLNPQTGVDAEGNPVLIQIGKDGTATQTRMPEGVKLSKEPIRLDAGTHFVLLDPVTRQPIGQIPKDLAGAEAQKEIGKQQGEAQVNLGSALQKADQSIALIDQMLEHPGRAAATGLSSVLDPRNYIAGTDATNFNVMRKQLEGKAFLEAFESLKGGGQITEVEGQRATEAIARLSTAQSEEAYVEALRELRGILELGKQRSMARAGQGQPPSPTTGMPGQAVRRYNPATGMIE